MIKPDEIVERRFRKTWRGYDPVEVNYFLEMLADEFLRLEERANKLEAQANEYERARKSYDKIVKEARDRAAQIILDAESVAASVLNTAQHQKQQIEDEILKLRHAREELIHQIQQVVQKQQQLLEMLSATEEFGNDDIDNAGN